MLCEVIDVPQPKDCLSCTPCMRIKLMEMGLISGQHIEIEPQRLGLFLVNLISPNGVIEQRLALRPEELDRVCLKQI